MAKFEKKYIENVLDALKIKTNKRNDRLLSAMLGLREDTIAQMKARKQLPIIQIVDFCLENKISIDEIFNPEQKDNAQISKFKQKEGVSTNLKNYDLVDADDYIRILKLDTTKKTKCIIENNIIYIFEEQNSYTTIGEYIIKIDQQNNTFAAINMKQKIDGKYVYRFVQDRDAIEYEINNDELNNIIFIGKIIKIIE